MIALLRAVVVFSAALLAVHSVLAQPGPAGLFPTQAEVYVRSDGLSRLELPSDVLTVVRPDLSDVRLFDAQGREVPYLVDRGVPQPGRLVYRRSFEPRVSAVDRATESPRRRPSDFREEYRLELAEQVPLEGRWRLLIAAGNAELVRRLDVEAEGPNGERTVLLQGESLFRLRDRRIERMEFDLPSLPSRTLHVSIEGEGGSYLSPTFILRQGRSLGERRPGEAELTILRRTESSGHTELVVERPRGLQLTALRFGTSSSTFARNLNVFDRGAGVEDRGIGHEKTIYRIPASVRIENLETEVSPAQGDLLRISIENGDSPPLEDLTVTALTTRPALLFSLAPGERGESAGILRFGGGRTARPRYDLAALKMILWAEGVGAETALSAPVAARLGPLADNSSFSAGPLLSFASRPGAAVDERFYSHLRYVQLAPSTEGLSRLELNIEDASHCRPDFADVRLVDESSAQWAYLLQPEARREWLALESAVADAKLGYSDYELPLPALAVAIDRLRLDFESTFFDRPYVLYASLDGSESEIARGRVARRAGLREPLEIEFAHERADSLRLQLFDGDDAPLAPPSAEGRFPLPDLYTVAPAGAYRLLLGHPEDAPPVYELARAASTVLAARGADATPGGFLENPRFSPGARLSTGPGSQRALFWIALVVAVGVLAAMTLKTVRGDEASESSG